MSPAFARSGTASRKSVPKASRPNCKSARVRSLSVAILSRRSVGWRCLAMDLWRAPVGPISISYAFPISKQPGDEVERLQFTFGGQF